MDHVAIAELMPPFFGYHMNLLPKAVDREVFDNRFLEALGWFQQYPLNATVAEIQNCLGKIYTPICGQDLASRNDFHMNPLPLPLYALDLSDYPNSLEWKRLNDYDRQPLHVLPGIEKLPLEEQVKYYGIFAKPYSDQRRWFVTLLDYFALDLLRRQEDRNLPFAWCWLTARRLVHRGNEESSRPRPPKKNHKETSQGNPRERTKRSRKEIVTLQDLADRTKKEYCGLPCYTIDKDRGFHMHGSYRALLHPEYCLFSVADVQAYEEQHCKGLFPDARNVERLYCRDKARQLVWGNPAIRSGEAARIIAETSPGKSLPSEKTIQNHISDLIENHKTGRKQQH